MTRKLAFCGLDSLSLVESLRPLCIGSPSFPTAVLIGDSGIGTDNQHEFKLSPSRIILRMIQGLLLIYL